MPHAYAEGLHTALTVLAWAAGALTVAVIPALLGLAFWWVGGLFEDALTVQRVRRQARRSGRTPGP